MFQRYSLFPWLTVQGNIAFGLREMGVPRNERERDRAPTTCGWSTSRDASDRIRASSRAACSSASRIAQTLACQPEILLMDEPFGALDAQTRRILQDELRRSGGADTKTVLFVTHDVEEAVALGTRIVVMAARPGRIKEVLTRGFDVDDGDEFEANPAFAALKLHVWRSVKEEVDASRACAAPDADGSRQAAARCGSCPS